MISMRVVDQISYVKQWVNVMQEDVPIPLKFAYNLSTKLGRFRVNLVPIVQTNQRVSNQKLYSESGKGGKYI